MLRARGARCVSVGPWCWGPIGPSRELKTQALNCLPNRGSSRGPQQGGPGPRPAGGLGVEDGRPPSPNRRAPGDEVLDVSPLLSR